ncbi:hypothetical protein Vadar_000249 [Vaccinium darrowii]|uniref:Uncharacterized protein n=1 Tax=Vaccinium darrowii TaxID=229202 RepID=A0ACB7WWP5_9ERIC|nr:hypothetical protein Vadar_000249 [Vaccinium darrowii]
MEFNRSRRTTTYKVWQPEKPLNHTVHTSPSTSPVHIHLDFLHRTTHRYYNRPHHDTDVIPGRRHPQLVAVRQTPTTSTFICIPADHFKSNSASHQIISQFLSRISIIKPQHHNRVADEIACRVRLALNWVSNMGRAVIPVRVEFVSTCTHVRDERALVARALRASVEERERMGVAAASKEAVRGLKRKRVVENGGESCRVCLEEFVKGEKVTFMPCVHVFHQGCIETWLGKSHSCPICRFKLPIAD